MAPLPRIIHESPNLENTIPINEHQSSFPEKFSLDDDKFVLCSGGEGFKVELASAPDSVKIHDSIASIFQDSVTIYVLNTSFLFFVKRSNIGIDIPYQSIALHALQGDYVYLQVVSNDYLFSENGVVELRFTRLETPSSKLFQHVPGSIPDIYHAMSKCSSLHYDSDSETEAQEFDFSEQPAVEIPTSWITEATIANEGNADDLEDLEHASDDEAGMNVDVGYGPLAGTIRRNSEEVDTPYKKRK